MDNYGEVDRIHVYDILQYIIEHTNRCVQKIKDLEEEVFRLKEGMHNGQTSIENK